MVCSACEVLTIDRLYLKGRQPVNTRDRTKWNRSGYLEFHPTYRSLQDSAGDGCTNCQHFHSRFVDLGSGEELLANRIAALAGSENSPVPVIAWIDFWTKTSDEGRSRISNLSLQVGTEIVGPGINPLSLTFKVTRPRGHSPAKRDRACEPRLILKQSFPKKISTRPTSSNISKFRRTYGMRRTSISHVLGSMNVSQLTTK